MESSFQTECQNRNLISQLWESFKVLSV